MSGRGPRLLALPAAAVLAAGLGACATGGGSGNSNAAQSSAATVSTTSSAPSSGSATSSSVPAPGSPVTQAQAQQIALAAAGAGAVVRHVSPLHNEHGQIVWTFEVTVGGQDRDIHVAQATGQVVNNETHHAGPTTASAVTQAQAQQIALATAGPGATVQHVDGPHDEHGQMAWTFEIAVGGQARDISVAQATGQVVSNEIHH